MVLPSRDSGKRESLGVLSPKLENEGYSPTTSDWRDCGGKSRTADTIMRGRVMKLLFLVAFVSLALLSSCAQDTNRGEVQFCPQNEEKETRRILGIESHSLVSESDILDSVSRNGLNYEISVSRYVPKRCGFPSEIPVAQAYMVYAGMDPAGSHTRNYLVFINHEYFVTHIVSQHAYKDPTFN